MKSLLLVVAFAGLQKRPDFFTTSLPLEEMRAKQAVVETSLGSFTVEFLPEVAPNHVGYFLKLSGQGAYNGTTFHRIIKYGIIQGGDPLSKDPARRDLYGTGGLGLLKAEFSSEKHTRGAVSAVLLPGKSDSAGSQFFICVTDQPALDGKYTVFGRVIEGMEVVQKISEVPADEKGKALERVEIRSVTLHDKPPSEREPTRTGSAGNAARHRGLFRPMNLPLAPAQPAEPVEPGRF